MSGIYTTIIPTLDTLADVGINEATLADDNLIQYDSTTNKWENAVPSDPYFIKVLLLQDDNTGVPDATNYLLGVDGQARQLEPQFSSDFDYNNTDWNKTTSTWTCPKKGIYNVNAQVAFRPGGSAPANDLVRQTLVKLFNGTTVVAKNQMKLNENTSTNDMFVEYNAVIDTLLIFDVGETLQMKLNFEVDTSTNMRIRASDNRTFLQIERIA